MSQVELSFRNKPSDRGGPPVLTVGQVIRGANRVLEGRIGSIWVEGEVSNLKIGTSGHAYFTLRDDEAALPVAMWRSSVERLRFRPENGQFLRVYGRLGIFAKQGRFQMYADRAQPAGLGALMLELEERKHRLAAEGLFATERKRALPRWPRTIGVVTSADGAAIHDILEVARRRCPSRILLAPAVVQGPDAPHSLMRALARLQRRSEVDVIIIGRGGGSVEDLWAFNDERLARAIAACTVPVVSAVGHEVDVSIADLVADVRAATPSQAAELVVPDLESLAHRLDAARRRLSRAVERSVLDQRSRLESLRVRLVDAGRNLAAQPRARLARLRDAMQHQHPRVRLARDRRRLESLEHQLVTLGRRLPVHTRARLAALDRDLFACGQALPRAARARLDRLSNRVRQHGPALARDARLRLARAAGKLDALSPLSVLERGYAVVTGPENTALTDARDVEPGDQLRVRLRRGRLRATVDEVDPSDDDR